MAGKTKEALRYRVKPTERTTGMSPAEYKATRERLGMTQAALADALDVSRKAINQREQGGTITREAAMALELLELRRRGSGAIK
jgi:DNA-binding XRE family transcriptional regulator